MEHDQTNAHHEEKGVFMGRKKKGKGWEKKEKKER